MESSPATAVVASDAFVVICFFTNGKSPLPSQCSQRGTENGHRIDTFSRLLPPSSTLHALPPGPSPLRVRVHSMLVFTIVRPRDNGLRQDPMIQAANSDSKGFHSR
ncbi:hypothetical protein PROFUN_12641 [Planoprotostelium fungivorum]|uniref:Uncharacterized protein n=1 Tax=Planoprotostelium fungivorum TaxID=1890364 RepID=A0A2P6N758_9EUKA|nr:hypothetical protein PROFUN_12641 [Planoprotostelium fungivorum]